MSEKPPPPFADTRGLARWIVGIMAFQAAVTAAAAWVNWTRLGLLEKGLAGDAAARAALRASIREPEPWQQAAISGAIVVFLLGMVLTAIWIYRSNRNMRAFGLTLWEHPAMSVAWYFVPFANLVMPVISMSRLWKGSANPYDWMRERAPVLLLGVWWALWLAANIAGNVSYRVYAGPPDPDMVRLAAQSETLGLVLTVPLCLVFMPIVTRISAMQAAAAERIFARLPSPVPAPD